MEFTCFSRRRVVLLGVCAVLVVVAVVVIVVLTSSSNSYNTQYQASVGIYTQGAVVSDTQLCSNIGSDLMRLHNGSAVDAVVAVTLCSGVTGLQAAGIGGGHFTVLYHRPRSGGDPVAVAVNARETAPLSAHRNMFQHAEDPSRGGPAIAVPGELKGLYEIWTRFGRLPWRQLVQPSIDVARDGFTISSIQEKRIADKVKLLEKYPSIRTIILKADGTPYVAGDVMTRPLYAGTLERIRDHGADDFYTGSLANDVILDIQDAGGNMTLEDLQSYTAEVGQPMSVSLENGEVQLLTTGLPSGGPIVQFILRVLQGFKYQYGSMKDLAGSDNLYQTMVETFKHAFAMRSYLGDDNYVDNSMAIGNLTSDDFIRHIRSKIDLSTTHSLSYYNAAYLPTKDHGTSHYSVVAPDGSAVSLTSSINFYFGSLVVGRRTGIVFNNEMGDFSSPQSVDEWGLRPSEANFIQPGKRPISSMTPAILLDNKTKEPTLVIGGAGGSKIISAISLVTLLNIHYNVSLPDAVDFPRVHHQFLPDVVQYEEGIFKSVLSGLVSRGHVIKPRSFRGVVNGIERHCDVTPCHDRDCDVTCQLIAVGDTRRYAKPSGWS